MSTQFIKQSFIGGRRLPRIFLAITLLFLAAGGSAQNLSRVDSLENLLLATRKEQRVDVLNELTKLNIGQDTAKANAYYQQAYELANKLAYKRGLAYAYSNQGTICYYKSEYTSDTTFQFRALQLFEQINDQSGIARSYANIGLALYAQSRYQEALEYHAKALEIRKKLDDKEAIADSYTSIGIVHFNQGNYSDALDFQINSLKLRESLKDEKAIANSNNNIGNIYKALLMFDKALECYSKALRLYERTNHKLGTAISSNNIAGIYLQKKQNLKALEFYKKSLDVYTSIGNPYNQVLSYNYIGQAYQNLGDNVQAREYYMKALIQSQLIQSKNVTAMAYNKLGALDFKEKRYQTALLSLEKAKEIAQETKIKDELSSAYFYLSEANAAMGNYANAYRYNKLYSQLLDTLRSLDVEKISRQQVKDIEEKKNHELVLSAEREKKVEAEVKKQKTIKYTLIGGSALLFSFLLLLFNRFRLIKSQKKIIEHEQKRSDGLLLNILPEDVAEELKQNGKAVAKSYSQVTVLFADIQNFTKIGENLTPEKLVSEIDFYFQNFDNIITKYGIEKIKTIGDAYMCAAGLNNNGTSSPSDMVHAALEIQDFVAKTREERKLTGDNFFEIRVGIHTGAVVAGIVGLKKFAYDIWGDAVNIAARMETAGETNRINISEATYQLVSHDFKCEPRGKIDVKNKGQMDMYFVEEVKSTKPMVVETAFNEMCNYVFEVLEQKLPRNLYYHGVHHTKDVLKVATELAEQENLSVRESEIVRIAALFHDSGFMHSYHNHEISSCEFASKTLPKYGYSPATVEEVCKMIMATRMPQSPSNHLERILCDADLDYLGRPDYDYISDSLYRELKEYGYEGSDELWREKQLDFLQNHSYFLQNSEARLQEKENNILKLNFTQTNDN